MFGKKNEPNDRYFEGLGMGEAKAYTRILDVLNTHNMIDDAYSVLESVKIICEYELRDNPYSNKVILFKQKPKEL